MTETNEAQRLERLWEGDFGDAYVERNRTAGERRGPFWEEILGEFPASRVLEVGCNVGANLRWLTQHVQPRNVFGVDVNQTALAWVRRSYPGVRAVRAAARDLPLRDGAFDLTFTTGVLIHQPPQTLDRVMSEIHRCSRRFILCGEDFAETETEVPYRGETGALFKLDFGRRYQQLFPSLILRKQGFVGRESGWDDVTYWLFEKP